MRHRVEGGFALLSFSVHHDRVELGRFLAWFSARPRKGDATTSSVEASFPLFLLFRSRPRQPPCCPPCTDPASLCSLPSLIPSYTARRARTHQFRTVPSTLDPFRPDTYPRQRSLFPKLPINFHYYQISTPHTCVFFKPRLGWSSAFC